MSGAVTVCRRCLVDCRGMDANSEHMTCGEACDVEAVELGTATEEQGKSAVHALKARIAELEAERDAWKRGARESEQDYRDARDVNEQLKAEVRDGRETLSAWTVERDQLLVERIELRAEVAALEAELAGTANEHRCHESKRLREELRVMREERGWRPIVAAPADSGLLLLSSATAGVYIGHRGRDPGTWVEEDVDGQCWPVCPTHWRPLPEPPKGGTSG